VLDITKQQEVTKQHESKEREAEFRRQVAALEKVGSGSLCVELCTLLGQTGMVPYMMNDMNIQCYCTRDEFALICF